MNAHAAPTATGTMSGRREGVRYRPFVMNPGEALILPIDPVERILRTTEFTATTGIARDNAVDSYLVAVPIPFYPNGVETSDGTRWAGVNPETLWHPFFWLPERLAERFTDHDDDNREIVESDDQWALRVMFEMTASGLYDPETGEWADVLAIAGLDLDDQDVLMRVTEWQLGVPDADLDDINLDALLRVEENPDWAIIAAAPIVDAVRRTVWARAANILLDWSYRSEQSFEDDQDHTRLRRNILSTLRTGQTLLNGVTEDGYGSHNAPGIDPFWAEQIAALDATPDAELKSLLLDEISVHCGDIRDGHWDITTDFWEHYAADDTAEAALGNRTEPVSRLDNDGSDEQEQ